MAEPVKRRRRNCPIPKSTFTTFMDEGTIDFRGGRFRKALHCYDRALDLQPNNKTALVARSQCHLRLGDAESALKDAHASLESKDDTFFIMGLYQYAEALFNLGLFESALIEYHKGHRCRKDKEDFLIGIHKCQDAIRTAIGDRQATQIEDLDVILPRISEMEAELSGIKGHCCVLPSDDETFHNKRANKSKAKKKQSMARSRWVDKEVLGVLQADKGYLTKFLKRPDIQGEQSGSENLRAYAKEALGYLEIRQFFWRQQNPMYARKVGLNFNNDMVLQYEKQEQEKLEASRRIKMDAAQGAILKILGQIEHALSIGRANDCQLECERALRKLRELSQKLLPRKPEFLTEIYHYKGLALMKLKYFEDAVNAFQEELNVATEQKMNEVKNRALDFLGKANALKGAYSEAAEAWDTKLALSKSPVERAYLFHELGRCYLEMHKPDLAQFYANQALEEASKINDDTWAMNIHILLGQSHLNSMSLNKALHQFEEAETFAHKCGNKNNVALLQEAQQCLKVWMEKKAANADDPHEKQSSNPDDDDDT